MILRSSRRLAFLIFDSEGTVLAEVPVEGDPGIEGVRAKPFEEAKIIARAIAEKLGVSADPE
jgi:hypothetical protein